MSLFVAGVFLALVYITSALFDDGLELCELVFQLLDVLLDDFLILFEELVAGTLEGEDFFDFVDDVLRLLNVLVAASTCLQVLCLDRLEIVVINYALLVKSLAEGACFTLLFVKCHDLNFKRFDFGLFAR